MRASQDAMLGNRLVEAGSDTNAALDALLDNRFVKVTDMKASLDWMLDNRSAKACSETNATPNALLDNRFVKAAARTWTSCSTTESSRQRRPEGPADGDAETDGLLHHTPIKAVRK